MQVTGTLYIIAAPSGGGKTSLVNALLKKIDRIKVSISHTTRPMRPGDHNGVDYYFVNPAEFEDMIAGHLFLEYAQVHDHYYGTSKEWVIEQLKAGFDIILEIDWQGYRQVKQQFPKSVGIFILPPSQSILRERLEDRRQDKSEVIERRLAVASTEISHCREFDYLIVNSVFEEALMDLYSIVQANRLRTDYQLAKNSSLLAELAKTV